MTAPRTPGPWVGDIPTRGNHARIIQPITGETIATVYGSAFSDVPTEEEKANASFIVTACNSHDALVEALRSLLDCSDYSRACESLDCGHCVSCRVSKARQALRAAGVEV